MKKETPCSKKNNSRFTTRGGGCDCGFMLLVTGLELLEGLVAFAASGHDTQDVEADL